MYKKNRSKILNFDVKQADTQSDTLTISGYIATFGVLDGDGDLFTDQTDWDTWTSSVPILYMHNSRKVLGYIESISKDDNGIFIEGTLIKTEKNRAEFEEVQKGLIKHLSAGLNVRGESTKDGFNITNFMLYEVSVVSIPAQREAEIYSIKTLDNINSIVEELGKKLNSMVELLGKLDVADAKKELNNETDTKTDTKNDTKFDTKQESVDDADINFISKLIEIQKILNKNI